MAGKHEKRQDERPRVTLGIWGTLAAIGWWLSRYDVLTADNKDSSIFVGASYVDVVGLFSTVNDYVFTALLTLAATVLLIVLLGRLHRSVGGATHEGRGLPVRRLALVLLILLVADFGFKGIVGLRQMIAVKPNEPVIQLPLALRSTVYALVILAITLIGEDGGEPFIYFQF